MPNVLIVHKKWLYLVAGIAWTMVGVMLCSRAIIWIDQFNSFIEIIIEANGMILATIGYIFVFSKIVKRNIKRIQTLPRQVSVFAFTPLRGYIMIGAMISLGILLRSLPFPKYYLSIPYTAMGGALLIGSMQFYWQYSLTFNSSKRKK